MSYLHKDIEEYDEIIKYLSNEKVLERYDVIVRPPRKDSEENIIGELTFKIYHEDYLKEDNQLKPFWSLVIIVNEEKKYKIDHIHYQGKLIGDVTELLQLEEKLDVLLDKCEKFLLSQPIPKGPKIMLRDFAYDNDMIEHYCRDYIDFFCPVSSSYELYNCKRREAIVRKNYLATEKDKISAEKNEHLYVLNYDNGFNWALVIKKDNLTEKGYFPTTFLKLIHNNNPHQLITFKSTKV